MDNNVVLEGNFPLKKERDSNFELYRIIMLLIIAHHYFVNSGLTLLPEINEFTARNAFLWVFGGYGKTGINCFVLLTGYFMCKSQITLSKFLKLLLQIEFYRIVFYIVFLIMGYETFSVLRILKVLIPITSVKQNFTEKYERKNAHKIIIDSCICICFHWDNTRSWCFNELCFVVCGFVFYIIVC